MSEQSQQRAAVLKGMAVTKKMVRAAQASHDRQPWYGITDEDMAKAIKAALSTAAKDWTK